MSATGNTYIGTSGWSYPHWKGPFYPADLPDSKLLDYYCQHFSSVEINNSFYHLPSEHALEQWRDTTPADFLFAAKASRYITHMKKLKDPQQSLATFIERIDILGNKLGPILYQLPPRWHCNPERLSAFLHALDETHRHAFEFRDESWINEDIVQILEQHNAAFCIYELAGYRSPLHVTADFVYIRLHGPEGAYQGSYDGRTLAAWARRIEKWCDQGIDVYCYFDNDEAGYAVENALDLQARLSP
jgi:uncharacterized protein YecE (DUF72 family)